MRDSRLRVAERRTEVVPPLMGVMPPVQTPSRGGGEQLPSSANKPLTKGITMTLSTMIRIVRESCGRTNPLYAVLLDWASDAKWVQEYERTQTWCCYSKVTAMEGGVILHDRCLRGRGTPRDTFYGNDGAVIALPVSNNEYWWNTDVDPEEEAFNWAEKARWLRVASLVHQGEAVCF